jgi:hypothetical protein
MSKRLSIAALICLLVSGTAAWYWWPRTPPADPQVQEAKALQTKLAASFTKSTNVDVKETVKSMTELRDSMEKMTPEQRRKVMTGPGGPMSFMRREAEEFAELPLEKRNEFLDKRIEQMEKFMKAMREMGGRPMGPPPGGPRGPSTPESRLDRSREMLNRTTPEDRALFSEYFTALMARRQELGLPGFGPR